MSSLANLKNALLLTPGSLYSNIVAVIVAELGLEETYPQIPVNIFSGENNTLDFLKLNHTGRVPVLIHQGQSIPESLDIAQFLQTTYGLGTLEAFDREVVAEVGRWRAHRISAIWYGKKTPDQDTATFEAKTKQTIQDLNTAIGKSDPEIAAIRSEAIQTRGEIFTSYDAFVNIRDKFNLLLDETNSALKNHDYIASDTFTLADIFATVSVYNHIKNTSSESVFTTRPYLEAYYKRVLERPAFKKAIV
ncbi:hypothetical protein DM01DRAFT_1333672 [Hesseltinella vesiculosa]|uniref:Glutathione S-transferase n=1 Tax=Hesseltinella vesiculosa TaxID=101127 RepID=A0A1X2GNK2_9FUNG|nr:hypothetical protein DM01DRAFT_1333672 [Hesseltinella vesiculosa]